MSSIPDLMTLCDGRPGIRGLFPVEIHSPAPEVAPLHGADGAVPPMATPAPGPLLDFIASDASLDRYREVISPAGWRLERYRRNPVFQNAHNYGDILFTLGKALITEVRGVPGSSGKSQAGAPNEPMRAAETGAGAPVLFQRIQFATEINPIARIAYGLYRGKFLNAVSVGFIPLRWEDLPEKDARGAGPRSRRRYLEQELLEVSAVGIPANPNALALAVKSGACVKSDLRDSLELLRKLLESAPGPGIPAPARRDALLSFARELRRILRRA